MLAGLLHDVLEDADDDARHLAQAVSEEKVAGSGSRPWKTRKLEQLAHLRGAGEQVALLKAADTLHNGTAIADDVSLLGWSVMERFNAGPAELLWYYISVLELVGVDCLSAACWWSCAGGSSG